MRKEDSAIQFSGATEGHDNELARISEISNSQEMKSDFNPKLLNF